MNLPEGYLHIWFIRETLPLRIYRCVDATYHREGEDGTFMTGREHILAATRERGVLRHERSQALRLFAMVFALVAGLAIVLGAMLSATQAASLFSFKQFRVPTDNSEPRHITVGSDGNLWFTEGADFFTPNDDPDTGGTFHNQIGRITPTGEITEFRVEGCQCFLNDIVQGPNNILYFTTNNQGLGRITTSGAVLPTVEPGNSNALGNGVAARGNRVWYTDHNNNSLWRYNVSTGSFRQYPVPTPGANPFDVAVDDNGIVWFTEFHGGKIGRLDPATGTTITETPVPNNGGPQHIAIASDGKVWFTERFNHRVGYLDPSNNNQVTQFDTLTPSAGPADIAAANDGSVWFTQTRVGNVARITPDGTITEAGKTVKANSGLDLSFGITMGPDGQSVWYTKPADNKIARLVPR
jgi:virginiamycin B lyase